MHAQFRVRFSGVAGGITLIVLLFHTLAGGEAPAREKPGYTAEEIIALVNKTYRRVFSASGRITRITDYGEGKPRRLDGRFLIRRPEKMLIELAGDTHQYMSFDGSRYRLYFPKDNTGYFTDTRNLSKSERYVLGPGPFFGNIFSILDEGYTFEVVDFYEGNLVVRATPGNPSIFKYILIGVAPGTWTIRAVEHFDGKDVLVNQTRYLAFTNVGDSLFFPTTVETATLLAKHVTVETTYLTRVRLNVPIEDDLFLIPDNETTLWKAHPFRSRR